MRLLFKKILALRTAIKTIMPPQDANIYSRKLAYLNLRKSTATYSWKEGRLPNLKILENGSLLQSQSAFASRSRDYD